MQAMLAVQAEVQNPLKLAKGNNYTYVELDALLDVVRPIASKYGLSIVQHVEGDSLVTELWHESGDTRLFRMPLKPSNLRGGSEAQQLGAAITYARKYSLMGLFAIHGDKDEDAQPAMTAKHKAAAELAVAQAEGVISATPAKEPNLADVAAKMAVNGAFVQETNLDFTTETLYNEWIYEVAKEKNMTQEQVRLYALNNPVLACAKYQEWKGASHG